VPKLFVAVDLPEPVTAELALLQPPPTVGLRLVRPGQMHLTLHYLGAAGIERMAAALQMVTAPTFPLAFEGVGQFRSADGVATLWAGVQESAELRTLHAAVAAALAGEGFRPEDRSYTPHVTLARCGPGVPADVVADFLACHAAFNLPAVPVARFALYSSKTADDGPVYRCERSFPLRATEARNQSKGTGGAR